MHPIYYRRKLAAIITLLLLLPFTASGGEFRLEYGIALTQEYTDNVYLTPDRPLSDHTTRVRPSIRGVYEAPFWEWDIAYSFDYRYYWRNSRDNDEAHNLSFLNRTNFIREKLFLEVRDLYRRVSLDTTRDYTLQSLFVNQTDSNDFSISPYARLNLTSHTTATVGYQYRNLWYKQTGATNKQEHTAFGELSNELSEKTSITAGTRLFREDSDRLTFNKVEIYAGPRYEYQDGSNLWFILGSSWFDPDQGDTAQQGFWDAGISHQFRSYTLSFEAALAYVDDPIRVQRREDRYAATFRKQTERTGITATAGRWEYRDIMTKRLQNTRNGLGGTVSYRITPALRSIYSLNIDRYEENQMGTFSMLYLNSLTLQYEFPAGMVLAGNYRFAHGYSPDAVNYGMNYDNNTVAVEIRKTF